MQERYHYVLGSSLCTGTSRFGTMNLFDITKEYVDNITGEVHHAELIFQIRMHWIFLRWFQRKQK